jgi:hypothetical protein
MNSHAFINAAPPAEYASTTHTLPCEAEWDDPSHLVLM